MGQWYFQRYVEQFPNNGEIVFFDRSWYNRAVVEPVNGFCSKKDYNIFMSNDAEIFELFTGNIENENVLNDYFRNIKKD